MRLIARFGKVCAVNLRTRSLSQASFDTGLRFTPAYSGCSFALTSILSCGKIGPNVKKRRFITMTLTEIFVNDHEVAGEYVAQAFFEWHGQEWEMTVKAASLAEAETLAKRRAEEYLKEWAVNQNAANDKYGVYPF
jgi:hypothetical protein